MTEGCSIGVETILFFFGWKWAVTDLSTALFNSVAQAVEDDLGRISVDGVCYVSPGFFHFSADSTDAIERRWIAEMVFQSLIHFALYITADRCRCIMIISCRLKRIRYFRNAKYLISI